MRGLITKAQSNSSGIGLKAAARLMSIGMLFGQMRVHLGSPIAFSVKTESHLWGLRRIGMNRVGDLWDEKTINCKRCGCSFKTVLGQYCDDCLEIEIAEYESKKRQEYVEKMRRKFKAICPPFFADTDPARIPQKALQKVLAWKDDKSGRGLLLHGKTGSCKTRALLLLLQQLTEKGKNPKFVTAVALKRELAASWETRTHEKVVNDYCHAHLLALDDLGKENASQGYAADLFEILRFRRDHLKPTFVTTNYVGETLAERLGDPDFAEPLVKTLRDSCQAIHFSHE